jgi:hypothetical protein
MEERMTNKTRTVMIPSISQVIYKALMMIPQFSSPMHSFLSFFSSLKEWDKDKIELELDSLFTIALKNIFLGKIGKNEFPFKLDGFLSAYTPVFTVSDQCVKIETHNDITIIFKKEDDDEFWINLFIQHDLNPMSILPLCAFFNKLIELAPGLTLTVDEKWAPLVGDYTEILNKFRDETLRELNRHASDNGPLEWINLQGAFLHFNERWETRIFMHGLDGDKLFEGCE